MSIEQISDFTYATLETKWHVSRKKIKALVARGLLVGYDIGHVVGRSQTRFTAEAVRACEEALRTPEIAWLLDED
jgi:hypothetical protein